MLGGIKISSDCQILWHKSTSFWTFWNGFLKVWINLPFGGIFKIWITHTKKSLFCATLSSVAVFLIRGCLPCANVKKYIGQNMLAPSNMGMKMCDSENGPQLWLQLQFLQMSYLIWKKKTFQRWGDMLVHGNRLSLLRSQVPDLTNNTFSFSLFNCRSQSEFISCMLGHEEEQLPCHPLCWLFLTVCMKLRADFFPTSFSN